MKVFFLLFHVEVREENSVLFSSESTKIVYLISHKKFKMIKTLIPIMLLFFYSCADKKNPKVEILVPGFMTVKTQDTTRVYKPDTAKTDYLHYRPLDLDVWYPAHSVTKDTSLLFHNILGLLEERANYYTASNAANGITRQLAQYFSDGLQCSDSTKVMNFKTNTFKNAAPVNAKFPLVIYLSAFNGMSYENFSLFEELAKKGFVVVAVSSIGRFPGDMTMQYEDLMEQVNDANAAISALKGYSNIDFTKIGVVGYSWGGLAGSVLAGKIPDIKCLISLDGSEFHQYGQDKEENADFDGIRFSTEFRNMKISVPYLRMESAPFVNSIKKDSVYNFSEKLIADKQIYKILNAQHEDFSSLPEVVKKSGNCESNQHYRTISKLTLSFLQDHLKNEKLFTKALEREMNKTIQNK